MRPKRIQELMGRGNIDDNIIIIIDDLMSYRHQQFSEIMKMPIPLIEKIMKRINKEKGEMAKAMKKK